MYYERALELYNQPLFELLDQARMIHTQHHKHEKIQRCALLSIKTGACSEDCAYCPQSAHYDTNVERTGLMELHAVQAAIRQAKASGAGRFCMGASGRQVKDGADFDRVLEMVRMVKEEGMEACVTLGMLTGHQAVRLKEAGLDAYNHNLDTSREFYPSIITTRTYDDRLQTLHHVREAKIQVCCGGIVGLGESREDRCALIAELASMEPQPESVPINMLIAVDGTPLEGKSVEPFDVIRMIAVARCLMPKTRIRLSAGRSHMSREAQALAFYAGANSVFFGEKLLTRDNPSVQEDEALFTALGT